MQGLRADMTARFPFEDASFDSLLSSEGSEHLPDPFVFLQECGRVTKPGGMLFLTTPNLLSMAARFALALCGNRVPIPAAALLGGGILVLADGLWRVLYLPQGFPLAVVTAVVGAPVPGWLVLRRIDA